MTSFLRYPHLERFGNSAVADIEFGVTHVFPKLDGTNASLWLELSDHGRTIKCGSRNRVLGPGIDNDNAGFLKSVYENWAEGKCFWRFFEDHPNCILYGEWLVPHTVKHYRPDAWKRFWIFDVYDRTTSKFLPYDTYKPILESYGLDFIPCIRIIKNGSYENFLHEAKNCRFLLPDEEPKPGEGIVIKNYDWTNKYQQVTWAKIVNGEFKDDFHAAMGASVLDNLSNAQKVCDLACTEHLIRKEYAKLLVDDALPRALIPRLLHTVFYSVVKEELWDSLKKINYGSINFQELKSLCILKTKQVLPEVF